MSETEKENDRDVIFAGPQQEDGSREAIRYRSEGSVDVGSLRPLEHGKPIIGDAVRLHARTDGPGMDVEYLTQEPSEPTRSEGSGPAKVNSKAFRDNWGEIFSKGNLFGSEIRPGSA
jgi:hypothetical protein